MEKTFKSQVSRIGERQDRNPLLDSAAKDWTEIFTALDKTGVPDEFLSPSDRVRDPAQERTL